MEQRTADKLKTRRLDRMRMGQAVATHKALLSDPEIAVAMVPLTEAEHLQCVEIITSMEAPDNIVGASARDRRNANEILLRSIREEDDLQQRMFYSLEEMTEVLEAEDVNYLLDAYFEMMEEVSPSAGGLSDREIDDLKKVLEQTEWSELSGKQCHALKNFLSTLGYTLLPDNLLGSQLINSLTPTNEKNESTLTVSPNIDSKIVKSAEN